MRVALTADPFIPVPPDNYGGIERIISFLAEGLTKAGIEVLLVAHRESAVNVPLIKYKGDQNNMRSHIENINTISRLKKWKPDIIHSFSRMAYLVPFLRSGIPKIMSYQREPTLSQIKTVVKIARKNTIQFTGCSNYITDKIRTVATANTVYNGVELNKYSFSPTVANDAPLIFLGRVEPIKGAHTAIDIASKTNRKLLIAGNVPDEYRGYFDTQIKPRLTDTIQYVGPVNDIQKNELLGKANALLMPIEWNEPFGIVMCEAMACGTPVIGFNKGAVPEVIRDNYSGFICSTVDEMMNAVNNLAGIDRANVFEHCRINFSSDVIVKEYIRLYKNMLN